MNKYGKYGFSYTLVFYGFLISFQFMSGSTEFPIYAIGLQPILHMIVCIFICSASLPGQALTEGWFCQKLRASALRTVCHGKSVWPGFSWGKVELQ
jgi:hypothetical protein